MFLPSLFSMPPRRLDRSAKRGTERPSLNDKRLVVEGRSLRSALRASVETTAAFTCDVLLNRRRRRCARMLPGALGWVNATYAIVNWMVRGL